MKRYRGGQPLAWRLEFKPQDLWIGVFWKQSRDRSWVGLVEKVQRHRKGPSDG